MILKNAIRYLGYLSSAFSPLFSMVHGAEVILYSGYIGGQMKRCGKRFRVEPRLTLLRGAKFIEIEDDVQIGKGVQLTATSRFGEEQKFCPRLTIGSNSSIGDYSHITCIDEIRIGNNVRMGKNILISDNAHGSSDPELLETPPNRRPLYSKGPVIIEDNVWIGEKTSILPGVHIGYGAIIGASSVVTMDVAPRTVVGGNPAKVLKTLA